MYNICRQIDYRPQPQLTEQQLREESLVDQLHELINCGDMEACRSLIRQNPRIINRIKRDVGSALHCAVAAGHAEVIRSLIEMGAVPDKPYLDYTPLHLAVSMGHIEAVKVLLEKGSCPEAYEDGGFCPGPLHDACYKGYIEIAQALIGAGARVARHDYEGLQALHYAAVHDDPDLTQMLLDAGADPNVLADRQYRTPIHRAAINGNLQTVKVLLAGGADPDGFRVSISCCARLPTTNHFPPIAYAIINDHCDVVAELVQSGADLKSPVKIREAFEEVVEELDRKSRLVNEDNEAAPDFDLHSLGPLIIPDHVFLCHMQGGGVSTMEGSSDAIITPDCGDQENTGINHSPLPQCITREKERKLFGKFGRDHPVFDGTMESLKYSVYTEKEDIIRLLLSSGKYSSSEIDSMKELAVTHELTRSLAALNKKSGSDQPGDRDVLTGK